MLAEGGSSNLPQKLEDESCCCCFPIECGMTWLSYFTIIFSALSIIDAFSKFSSGPEGSTIEATFITMLVIIIITLGVQLFFLIQWAIGERSTEQGGTKTTRENLPNAYLVEIAQKVIISLIAIFSDISYLIWSSGISAVAEDNEQLAWYIAMALHHHHATIKAVVIVLCVINVYISYYFYSVAKKYVQLGQDDTKEEMLF